MEDNPLAKLRRFMHHVTGNEVVVRASPIMAVDKEAGTVRLASGDVVTQAVPDELSGGGDAVLVVDDQGANPMVVSRVEFSETYRDLSVAENEAADAAAPPAEPQA